MALGVLLCVHAYHLKQGTSMLLSGSAQDVGWTDWGTTWQVRQWVNKAACHWQSQAASMGKLFEFKMLTLRVSKLDEQRELCCECAHMSKELPLPKAQAAHTPCSLHAFACRMSHMASCTSSGWGPGNIRV